MNESYKEYLRDKFKRKVWNALGDVATEFCEVDDETHEECMEEAIEYFMIHFYNLDK